MVLKEMTAHEFVITTLSSSVCLSKREKVVTMKHVKNECQMLTPWFLNRTTFFHILKFDDLALFESNQILWLNAFNHDKHLQYGI